MTESVQRFYNLWEIAPVGVISLSAAAILLNGFSALILRQEAIETLNIKSSYLHLATDMFTSVAVLIGGIMIYLFKIYWIDGGLTLIIAGYLIFSSIKMLMETIKVLMLFTPSSIIIEDVNQKVCALPGIRNIHHIHVWQLDNRQIHFEGHVDFNQDFPLDKVNSVLEQLRIILHEQFKIDHATFQPEYDICHEKDLISKGH